MISRSTEILSATHQWVATHSLGTTALYFKNSYFVYNKYACTVVASFLSTAYRVHFLCASRVEQFP